MQLSADNADSKILPIGDLNSWIWLNDITKEEGNQHSEWMEMHRQHKQAQREYWLAWKKFHSMEVKCITFVI